MSDYFIFDDIDTRNYEGIYVYFDDVDAIPSRVGEFIDIPGRNGSFYLDKGRFEDVTHTYDIIALTKEVGSDLINAIASKVGYHRLEDSFNPDEFYSAVFASEIEPTVPTDRSQVTFKLMFTRKPQRFLTSGETAVTVSSGDTLTNPTLFDASPMLEAEGYGNLNVNGYEIELNNITVGHTILANPQRLQGEEVTHTQTKYIDLSTALIESSDPITLNGFSMTVVARARNVTPSPDRTIYTFGITGASGSDFTFISQEYGTREDKRMSKVLTFDTMTVDALEKVCNMEGSVLYGSTTLTFTISLRIYVEEDISDGSQRLCIKVRITNNNSQIGVNWSMNTEEVTAESTQTLLGHPTYIDCDLGEAYKVVDGAPVSLNRYIDLGSKLPELSSGANEITFDNTITDLKVVPHWWKV